MQEVKKQGQVWAKAYHIVPLCAFVPIRPKVIYPTVRYQTWVQAGRGFGLKELVTDIHKKVAHIIIISEDSRGRNQPPGPLQEDIYHEKEYCPKALLPHWKTSASMKGDSYAYGLKLVTELIGPVISIQNVYFKEKASVFTEEEKHNGNFACLHMPGHHPTLWHLSKRGKGS